MLVGAVDFAGDVRAIAMSRSRNCVVDSPGECTAAGSPADGAVALVLQRTEVAVSADKRVYATVRGCGFASGGVIGSAEEARISQALARAAQAAGVPADALSLVMTGAGDADAARAEWQALDEVFTEGGHTCAVGHAAGHVGHAGAAGGLVSVAGAALALYHQTLPVQPGFERPAEGVGPTERLFVPHEPQAYVHDRARGPRRAGVSAMAGDGTCACTILEEQSSQSNAHAIELHQPLGSRTSAVFAVGADDAAGLIAGLADLATHAGQAHGADIERLARSWWDQRRVENAHPRAVAIVADSSAALAAACTRAQQHLGTAPEMPLPGDGGVHYFPKPLGPSGDVAFVFPGSGNHYLGMGRELAAQFPHVLRAQQAETATLASQLHAHLFTPQRSDYGPRWREDAARRIAADNRAMIMGQVAYGALMSDVLSHLGLKPRAVIGYSLGETAGLFALRAWRERDEMFRRMQASPLFATELAGPCDAARRAWRLGDDESVDWRVVLVNRPASEVRQAVLRSQRVYLLITNAPEECVIGGRGGDVEDVLITLGCEAIDLVGASAVHCGIVREVADAYRDLHLLATTPPEGVRFYSAAAAEAYAVTRASAASSILQQALDGFDFPKLIHNAYADGVRVFIEVGPQNSCTRMISRILAGQPHHAAAASGRREVATLLELVAGLVAQRVLSDLTPLYGVETCVPAHGDAPPADEGNVIVVPTGAPAPNPQPPRHGRRKSRLSHAAAGGQGRPTGKSVPHGNSLATACAEAESAATSAHDAYLRFSQAATAGMGVALQLQARLLAAGARPSADALSTVEFTEVVDRSRRTVSPHLSPVAGAPGSDQDADVATDVAVAAVAYPRALCMEFAIGSVARVLGPEFAEVDTYPVRVRLPDEPLMLVDRILEVEGEKNSLGSGRVVTEHDVRAGDWYLDGGVMPTAITVESGQADLFLCAYLGIDLRVRGRRAYRLLDAAVNFHRHLPQPGETVRYDIRIDRFVRQGDTYLFFFEFDGSVNGVPVLSMRSGCAGFFTEQEIRESGGIIETAAERKPEPRSLPADWRGLAPLAGVEAYSVAQVDALRRGDLAACFGPAYADLPLRNPVRLPDGRLRLVDRVVALEPGGGRYGLGLIRAEADIHPDDWFLTCHFVDDMVMPGTLMYECCMHTLRILLMRIGWVAEHDAVRYEPVPGVSSALRCRGPVTAATRVVTYEVHVKELGYGPEPFAIADALMYADGEKIVRFTDMSVKLSGLKRDDVERLWSGPNTGAIASSCGTGFPVGQDRLESRSHSVTPIGEAPLPLGPAPAVFDYDRILAFAIGKPSEAFGDPYRVFDAERRIARLPGPPYQVLDRITQTRAQPWKLSAAGWIEGQYDVPPDAWYFAANRQRTMPFAVLLEIALQPCGWLAAYAGSALRNAQDLSFRNLGGTATLYEEVGPDAGTLTTRVRMTRASEAGGMIIEDFQMQVWRGATCVYDGHTNFGFFTAEALARQVGIRDAGARRYTPDAAELARSQPIALADVPPLTPDDAVGEIPAGLQLPGRALRMVDAITCYVPDGGPHGLGYVRGIKRVDPAEWFFAAHFYQDPVCPGSLGLESFLQLLKAVALERFGDRVRGTHRFTPILLHRPHTWTYRGQVIPTNREVTVEAVITAVDDGPSPAIHGDGFLSVDGVTIYAMRDFGIGLVPL
ncbi:MAG TPA: hypothetical protein P5572_05755 [Phycisphaerae bacterium]|nr:hypothetical protein [Phycisphaerae bacterium]